MPNGPAASPEAQDVDAAERWAASAALPPTPVGDAENALVEAVAQAVLDWAGLEGDEADAPGYQTILVPSRITARLIGKEALADFKGRGFMPV